ncbi:hypothetical protein ACSLVQ_30320, partial [Klebsiella pneumoniae]|uniref:hypothetical protein n=1 Tax=Klebsiella pneumoniae TaxID=573 RepID=UPI003EE37639
NNELFDCADMWISLGMSRPGNQMMLRITIPHAPVSGSARTISRNEARRQGKLLHCTNQVAGAPCGEISGSTISSPS